MERDFDDFLDNLNYFLSEYRFDLPTNYLPQHGLNSTSDIVIIIGNALKGKKENGLDRLKNVRDYLTQCLNYYKDTPMYQDDEYDQQMELEEVFTNLITDLEPENFAKISGVMTPDQIMAVTSWLRQKFPDVGEEQQRPRALPVELQREVLEYAGIPKGGRRKKGTKKSKSKRTKKSKSKRTKKSKTKRRKNAY